MRNNTIRKLSLLFLAIFAASLFLFDTSQSAFHADQLEIPFEEEGEEKIPNDYFFRQRAYPQGFIPQDKYLKAVRHRNKAKQALTFRTECTWEAAGPLNIGGRISSVEVHPSSPERIYVGAASGGIFRSEDAGESWTPIFDDAMSLSIGDIAIAHTDPMLLYVGTGEANAGGGSLTYDGVGVYKSTTGGNDWKHVGLDSVGSIGKVIIDPQDTSTVFVAAMGDLFGNNSQRGVYRTQDGGENWEQVLYVSDSTGAIDMVINPDNPDIIYAAMWERVRRPSFRKYGGPTSGIFRSIDGGDTWEKLESGIPGNDNGRIGLAIFPQDPSILYAYITDDVGYLKGIFKSSNSGDDWDFAGISGINNVSYMWWFGRIFMHPTDENTVYALGLDIVRSTSGGVVWLPVFSGVHVDQHDLYIHPSDPDYMLLANDGGLYMSLDGGSSWEHLNNIPITQFYTCEVDYQNPERLYGGTQDNSTVRTLTGAFDDWEVIHVGDGFSTLVDPIDNNYIFTESQYGNLVRSTNGGASFAQALTGMSGQDRRNWNTPVVFDPLDSETLFYGAQKVYKSSNRGSFWTAISDDLTNGSGGGNLVYGTITSIDVSPIDPNIIYAGTDDGNVWNTLDGGDNWNKLSDGLPTYWVTKVATHPLELSTAYVCLSGYRYNTYEGHIYKTTDNGLTWENITGDLPDVPVNDIIIDSFIENQLFIATDIGVYSSLDAGTSWNLAGDGLPNVPVLDLCLHQPTRKLVAGTYGRSLFTYEIPAPTATQTLEKTYKVVASPNPFKEQVNIQIELDKPLSVGLSIWSVEGKLIKQVFQGKLTPGLHTFEWKDELPAGNYYCNIETEQGTESIQLVKTH